MAYSKKVASKASITNQNQGGGSKKSGFPYQIGRSSWTSIAFGTTNPTGGKCCSLKNMNFVSAGACISRPIGAGVAATPYYHCPGTR